MVQIVARYQETLEEALDQSVMAGGDSAARGMIVGMVLGVHLGEESLPREWLADLGQGEGNPALIKRLYQVSIRPPARSVEVDS